jgi:hypothetical protein
MSKDPAGTSTRAPVFSRAAFRHVFYGELAVAVRHVNEFAYELARSANRVEGWLLKHRDARNMVAR